MSDQDSNEEAEIEPPRKKTRSAKGTSNKNHLATQISVSARIAQFPKGAFVERIDLNGCSAMWCPYCGVHVNVEHANFGKSHLNSRRHTNNKEAGKQAFGASGALPPRETFAAPNPSSLSPSASPRPMVSSSPSLSATLKQGRDVDNINADFTAGFLGARIAIEKLDHTFMRGLFRKYTSVHRSIRAATKLREDVNLTKL